MRSPRPFLAALLVASSLAAGARANQPAQPAGKPLTLDEALQLSRRANKDLQAARSRLQQSALGMTQAWVALLPQVAAQGKYTRNYKEVLLDLSQQTAIATLQANFQTDAFTDLYTKVGKPPSATVIQDVQAIKDYVARNPSKPIQIQVLDQLDASLNATVPLIVPWAYQALDSAKKTYGSAESTYAVSIATTLYATAQAFYVAAGADELLVTRRNAIAVARQTLENARTRFDAGVVTRVDVTRAEIALVKAEQSAVESEDAQAQAYRALATLIQLREPFHVVGAEAAPVDTGTIDVAMALHLRPEVAALERTVLAADATASSSLWRWAPTLSAFGNLRAFNYAGFSGDHYAWAAGVQLDWTVYDGGLRDVQRKLAEEQRRESAARLSLLRDTLSDDLANAERALRTKRRALQTALRSVDLARETINLVRAQYEAGTATQLDLLTAQDTLISADVAVAQARFDAALAELTLQRTEGTFPPSGS